MSEKRLSGGHLSSAVRVGDTVRRRTGPWSPTVHQLLGHLEAVGFPAPRFLGIDEEGREVLSFVPGKTVGEPPWPQWMWDDGILRQMGRQLRRYHEAVAAFEPPADAAWRFAQGRPRQGQVICHNDIAPQNMVFRGGRIIAFLDWDWAGLPEWDLAHAAWLGVPLLTPEAGERQQLPSTSPDFQARRLHLLCEAYGLDGDVDIIDVIAARIQTSIHRISAHRRTDPALAALTPFVPGMKRTLEYVQTERGRLW